MIYTQLTPPRWAGPRSSEGNGCGATSAGDPKAVRLHRRSLTGQTRMQEDASIQLHNGAHDLTVHPNHQKEKTKPNSQQQRHQVDNERCHQAAQPTRRYQNRRRRRSRSTSIGQKRINIIRVLPNYTQTRIAPQTHGQVSELRRIHRERHL